MKIWLSEDEHYPHVFVKGTPERFWSEVDVPSDLGSELLVLREREKQLLHQIAEHLKATGQPAAFEDFYGE